MYKKALIFIVNLIIIYILSVSFAEVVNFLYIMPFVSAFFFFESLVIYGFFNRNSAIHMSFVFGFLSDIIALHNIFVFSAAFPFIIFLSEKISYDLKLDRYAVCTFFYLSYALVMYFLYGVSIVILLFLFILTYLFCVLLNYVFYKINIQKKADGEER